MASTALAHSRPDPEVERRFTATSPVIGQPKWERRNDGLTRHMSDPVPVASPAKESLPLAVRATVILGGALLGWAVPIALVTSLVR